ncbi:MAG: hypothetical protein PSV46_16330 [Reyranella sp.]|nr:hypothetical protein [Reyranella sp.]
MTLEEAEPIDGFAGVSVFESLLRGGIFASVIGCMFYIESELVFLGHRLFADAANRLDNVAPGRLTSAPAS